MTPFLIYLLLYLISFLACILSASYMKTSLGWAIFIGLLFCPGAGIGYTYMALSGDRKTWHAIIVSLLLPLILALTIVSIYSLANETRNLPVDSTEIKTEVTPVTQSKQSVAISAPQTESDPTQVFQDNPPSVIGSDQYKQDYLSQIRSINLDFNMTCLGDSNSAVQYIQSGDYASADAFFKSAQEGCIRVYSDANNLSKLYGENVPTNYSEIDYYLLLASGYLSRSIDEYSALDFTDAVADANRSSLSEKYITSLFASIQ